MRLLIDTHAFLWFAVDDPQISNHARDCMADPGNEIFLSAASYWEMCLKISTGKLKLTPDWQDWLPRLVRRIDLRWLQILPAHCEASAALPRHHGDPFDRMLVAQARHEGLTIITVDGIISDYGVPVLW